LWIDILWLDNPAFLTVSILQVGVHGVGWSAQALGSDFVALLDYVSLGVMNNWVHSQILHLFLEGARLLALQILVRDEILGAGLAVLV